jgi:hypothetical protein
MIWALLAAVGVPLWLCAAGILTLVLRNRSLRHRPGNIAVRQRQSGKKRWTRGHAVWVHDVLAFRGSPAAWREVLIGVRDGSTAPASSEEQKKLRSLGESPVIARFTDDDGAVFEFASGVDHATDLVGPLRPPASTGGPSPTA